MAIDINLLVRKATSAVKYMEPVNSFFSPFFGEEIVDGESITYDRADVKNRIASYVKPGIEAPKRQLDGFKEHSLKLPCVKAGHVITGNDVTIRSFDGSLDYNEVMSQRIRKLVAEALTANQNSVDIAIEKMRCEVLFGAQIAVLNPDGGYDETFTFPRNPDNVFSLSPLSFLDQLGADVNKVWNQVESTLNNSSGKRLSHAVARIETMQLIVDKIKEQEGKFYVPESEISRISYKGMQENGGVYFGIYRNTELWGYNGAYTDIAGTSHFAVPEKECLFLSKNTNNKMTYGESANPAMLLGLVDRRNFVKTRTKMLTLFKADQSSVSVESAQVALPVLKDGDATVVVTVLS